MSDFFPRQARKITTSAMAPVEAAGSRLLGLISIGGIALLCLIATIIFLSVALDLWLSGIFSPVIGALATAGFYFLIVLICLVILAVRREKKPATLKIQRKIEAKTEGKGSRTPLEDAETTEPASGLSANLEEAVMPFLAILQRYGMKREAVAVQLATEATKELGPLALVTLAVAAGFLCERQLNRTAARQAPSKTPD